MIYVVTDACIQCKYTDCVDVCPTDAFREGPNFLAIDPSDCIDCTLCVAECRVQAIHSDDRLPLSMHAFLALNADLARRWAPIIERKAPLPDADRWAKIPNKLPFLRVA